MLEGSYDDSVGHGSCTEEIGIEIKVRVFVNFGVDRLKNKKMLKKSHESAVLIGISVYRCRLAVDFTYVPLFYAHLSSLFVFHCMVLSYGIYRTRILLIYKLYLTKYYAGYGIFHLILILLCKSYCIY